MAIFCLGNSSLRIDGYGFIGELALAGSVRPVTGVLPMARCLPGGRKDWPRSSWGAAAKELPSPPGGAWVLSDIPP
jgi:hypothetical protein